jgi:hypothetical protein
MKNLFYMGITLSEVIFLSSFKIGEQGWKEWKQSLGHHK